MRPNTTILNDPNNHIHPVHTGGCQPILDPGGNSHLRVQVCLFLFVEEVSPYLTPSNVFCCSIRLKRGCVTGFDRPGIKNKLQGLWQDQKAQPR